MKTKRTIALSAALLLLVLTLSSCSLTSTEIQFKQNDKGYALYRYTSVSAEESLTVPETYAGEPVTELMSFSVANAEYLKTVYLGKNIETIDPWSFTNCPLLENIIVDAENPNFTSVDGVLYNKDMTALLVYPNGKSPIETDDSGKVISGGTLVLPDSVKTIRDNAFYLCSNLYTITFNEGLESIGNKAFLKCSNLQAVELPNTVTQIGADAFSYCDALTALEIPASVEKIGDYAFFSTSSSIEKIIVHRASADGLELGTDWMPNKKNSVRDKVEVVFSAE